MGFGFNNLLFLSSLFYFSYKIQDTWSISSSVFIPLIIIIFYSVSLFFNINFQVRVKMKVDSWAWATCFFTRKGLTVSLPCIASCLFAVRTHNSCKIILGFTSWKRKLTSGGFCNFFLIWDFGFLYLRNKINGGQNNVLRRGGRYMWVFYGLWHSLITLYPFISPAGNTVGTLFRWAYDILVRGARPCFLAMFHANVHRWQIVVPYTTDTLLQQLGCRSSSK